MPRIPQPQKPVELLRQRIADLVQQHCALEEQVHGIFRRKSHPAMQLYGRRRIAQRRVQCHNTRSADLIFRILAAVRHRDGGKFGL